MLDNLNEIVTLLITHRAIFTAGADYPHIEEGELQCPGCGGPRRMRTRLVYSPPIRGGLRLPTHRVPFPTGGDYEVEDSNPADPNVLSTVVSQLIPTVLTLSCLQCKTSFTSLIYVGPTGPALAVFPSRHGGLSTPHTPKGVAFYLDQAHRAHSVGAFSAAMAMYRGALEHLLFEQGYTSGMLATKITRLEQDINSGACPPWARELDTDYLNVIKDLGNGCIHPNDGDVAKQAVIDQNLLSQVELTFGALLYLVCEAPQAKRTHLSALQKAANLLKK